MTSRDKPGIRAPGAGDGRESGDWLRAPRPNDPLPAVTERLVMPETRAEYLHGIELFAAPADAPHATQHFDLAYVLGAHVRQGYRGAVDMLTRTGHASDFAPDASVFSAEVDTSTGERKLEELAFEVVAEQAIGVPTEKARQLVRRGVKQVFCIVVKHRHVLEWDAGIDDWRTMTEDSVIEAPCLTRPLAVQALLDSARADEAVVQALLARGTEALQRLVALSKVEGKAEGKAESLITILEARGFRLRDDQRGLILGCTDVATIDQWLKRAVVGASVDEILE